MNSGKRAVKPSAPGLALSFAIGSAAVLIPFATPSKARAVVEPVLISSDEVSSGPRWMFGIGEIPKVPGIVGQLSQIKKAQLDGDLKKCVQLVHAARGKAKSLQGWLAVIELDCVGRMPASVATSDTIHKALRSVDQHSEWLFVGPQAALLRQAYVKAAFNALEQDTKTNRARAWSLIDRLREMDSYMDQKTEGKLWRAAGEVAFAQQKTEAARDLLRRSLAQSASEETRARLNSVEAILRGQDKAPAGPESGAASGVKSTASPGAASNLEASGPELELEDRVTMALKGGDLVGAVSDAAKLIREFPGGTRAKWATDRIFEAFMNVSDRTDSKNLLLREQMLKQMESVDADRLAEWSRLLYNRGLYEDSLQLGRKSLETLKGVRATKVLETTGEAAIGADQFDAAIELFTTLNTQHAGTPAAREALLRIGLLHVRQGKHEQAVADLERLLAFPQTENLELTARYWLWRSLQKMKSDRADAAADEMMKRFPFSYYGLRARFERNGGILEWKTDAALKKAKVESKIWLTSGERLAWEKAQLLIKAGWLDEAQAELRELPAPVQAEDKAVRALLWAAASQYGTASKLANEAWDEKSELRRSPFTRSVFPMDFQPLISTQASARKLDRYLVAGLIKQESAYNARAVSPANAFGLMQLVGPTAREAALDLRLGRVLVPDDLFQPQTNIKLGTYYLSRLVTKYQGTVPLALASYNAGQGRIDRWLKSRQSSLKSLVGSRSSAPEDELWIDELPYAETSYYVKAILRNILLYRVLDQGRVEVANPVWAFDSGS